VKITDLNIKTKSAPYPGRGLTATCSRTFEDIVIEDEDDFEKLPDIEDLKKAEDPSFLITFKNSDWYEAALDFLVDALRFKLPGKQHRFILIPELQEELEIQPGDSAFPLTTFFTLEGPDADMEYTFYLLPVDVVEDQLALISSNMQRAMLTQFNGGRNLLEGTETVEAALDGGFLA
jgi:hypothetical protein